jgi:hypothetical protein
LHWYTAADDWETQCAYNGTALDQQLSEDRPAVVIAHSQREAELDNRLVGYDKRLHYLRTIGRELVIYVDEDALAESAR